MFEKFVRFDTGGRSGLGLAIAKAFVEAHGDRIWVEDAPGRRSSLRFHAAGRLCQRRGWEHRPMASVLVVDDDPALLRALRVSLHLKGHEVVTAADGRAGDLPGRARLARRDRARPRAYRTSTA